MSLVTTFTSRVRRLWREMAKFGSVGAMSTVVQFTSFNLLHQGVHLGSIKIDGVGLGPITANTLATVVATTFAYLGNRFWTFRHHQNTGMGREYIIFFGLNGIGLVITNLFIGFNSYVLNRTDSLSSNIALVIGTGVATLFRYWAYKRWVFRPAPQSVAPVAAPQATALPPHPGGVQPNVQTGQVAAHHERGRAGARF